MLKRLSALAIAISLSASPRQADAWGTEGHEIVAAIAFAQLSPQEQSRVTYLLRSAGHKSFIAAAPWADVYRRDHAETESWHFVNIPLWAPAYVPARDCRTSGDQSCAVEKIGEFAQVLAGPHNDSAKGTALAFLIHLVGDIHSPMHAVDNRDLGGNKVHVLWRGQEVVEYGHPLNLHHAWDDQLVAAAVGDDAQHGAQFLDAAATPAHRAGWCAGSPADWANEAHQLAQQVSYGELHGADLDEAYIAKAGQVVDLQLERAGIRLACLIKANLR